MIHPIMAGISKFGLGRCCILMSSSHLMPSHPTPYLYPISLSHMALSSGTEYTIYQLGALGPVVRKCFRTQKSYINTTLGTSRQEIKSPRVAVRRSNVRNV